MLPLIANNLYDICLTYVSLILGLFLLQHYTITPFMWLMPQQYRQQLSGLIFFNLPYVAVEIFLIKKKKIWLWTSIKTLIYYYSLVFSLMSHLCTGWYRHLCTWDSQFLLPELQVHWYECGKLSVSIINTRECKEEQGSRVKDTPHGQKYMDMDRLHPHPLPYETSHSRTMGFKMMI